MKSGEFSFDRIIEIITVLVKELSTAESIESIDLSKLEKRGYSKAEIYTALSWIADKIDRIEKNLPSSHVLKPSLPQTEYSLRVLNDYEKKLFTKEGWGELITLAQFGVITSANIEEIIESAAFSDAASLNRDDVRNFVALRYYGAAQHKQNGKSLFLGTADTIH